LRMQEAAARTDFTIAVLSESYRCSESVLRTKCPVLDESRDWSQLRRLVREFHVELFDITPSPALGWIVALDDRVLGFVKMRPGMAIG
jgi:hypothetical protein